MPKADARIRLHSFYVGRLRRSRLRAAFHERVAEDAALGFHGGWVLDVGCGPGLLEPRLAKRLPRARLVALDIDRKMLGIAKAERAASLTLGNVASLPFKNASLALVVSTASLKDWGRPELGLREISRVLAPDGRALIFDFLTAGPGSRPHGAAGRFGLVSWVLGRLATLVWPFTIEDARRIAGGLGGVAIVEVSLLEDLGAVRIEVRPLSIPTHQ